MISSDKNMALSSKRPFCDDEPCQLASKKHLGHLEYNSEHRKLTEVIPSSRPMNLFSSVEECAESSWVFQGYQPLASHTTSDIQAVANRGLGVDIVPRLPDLSYCTAVDGKCNSFFADTTSRKEMTGLSAVVSRTVQELEMDPSVKEYYESFIPAIDRYPRKLVAIGSRHQIEVPAWELERSSTGSSRKAFPSNQLPVSMVSADKERDFSEEEDQRLMGTCVIPMPDVQSSNQNAGDIGHGRFDCVCPDHGSLGCVRQHILEQREHLKDTIGHDRFTELGFDNMGEEVSARWSKEAEQLFQDVVYSNPASMNKDFWKELSVVFPTKSKGEIVSYYFNVFMLRRRAVQNRWDQSDIDSDNDEWQSDDDEFAVSEEDEEEDEAADDEEEEEDSGVESQAADVHVDIGCDQQAYDVWEDYCEEEDDLDGYEEIGLGDACESHAAKGTRTSSPNNCKFNMIPAIGGGNQSGGVEDQDVQEGSCISDECYQIGVGSQSAAAADAGTLKMRCPGGVVKAEIENFRIPSINEYDHKCSAGIMAHGYLPENPCDLKMWDGNFLSVSKKDMDILPTCSMMKEIFGEESWNNDPLRGSPRIH